MIVGDTETKWKCPAPDRKDYKKQYKKLCNFNRGIYTDFKVGGSNSTEP